GWWRGGVRGKARVDELAQLLNVLVGDMSLIGPRPLLPQDQPPTPTVRLMVRPGMTGWAQVNGGTLLSAREKEALDEWYIRHASPWLDLRIIAMTAASLIRGDRRREDALAQALRVQSAAAGRAKERHAGELALAPVRARGSPMNDETQLPAARAP